MAWWGGFPKYVPVAQRRAKARKELEKLRKKGKDIQPIELDGRTIARSFWGKGWCDHLESFSDYENRLPRGRTYVRNGSVCHLEIEAGRIHAMVSGSSLYKITIKIKPLAAATWKAVKEKCRGQIGSMLELLRGQLSDHVMAVVSDRKNGLFPKPGEIDLNCSCPDWATMCKHVAAALYGVGSRLDTRPELLFILRGVAAEELIAAEVGLPLDAGAAAEDTLAEAGLSEIFGIDLDLAPASKAVPAKRKKIAAVAPSAPVETTPAKKVKPGKPARKIPPKLRPSRLSPSMAKTLRKLKKELAKKKSQRGKSIKPAAKKSRRTARPAIRTTFNPAAPTGTAIARLRKQTGLSEAGFARTLGVTEASVRRWEGHRGALTIYARPLAALTKLQDKLAGK